MIQHIFSLLASEKRLKELGELLDYHSHFPDFDVPGEMNDIIDDVIDNTIIDDMSVIKDNILYSKQTVPDCEPLTIGQHDNFAEYIFSVVNVDQNQTWLVNAGYDLTGINRSACGKVQRKYWELEPLSRRIGKQFEDLGVRHDDIVQVKFLTAFIKGQKLWPCMHQFVSQANVEPD